MPNLDYNEYLISLKESLDKSEVTEGKHTFSETQLSTGLQHIFDLVYECKKLNQSLFICGNGGSAGIAQHMTADYLKNGGIRAQSLFNAASITCVVNDLDFRHIFAGQLDILAKPDDVLIAISSSGNSEDIVFAAETMHRIGGKVISLSGFDKDNHLRKTGDINYYVPCKSYGIVESVHTIILQMIVDDIVERDGTALKL